MEYTADEPMSWEAVGGQLTGLLLGRDASGGQLVRPAGPSRVKSQYHVWSSNAPLMTDVRDT